MKILGIETSCDDTAAAVVEDGQRILSNIISSQNEFHAKYGGIVPEIASRKHVELILYVIQDAMETAGVDYEQIDAIAVTNRPGLVGSLLIGLSAAKGLAYCHKKALIGVDHLLGHIYANYFEHPDLELPHISLTVSGGHTLIMYVRSRTTYEILGHTVDDAIGEAYDKVAKFLGLGFPGGPLIDTLARTGDPNAIDFPSPLIHADNLNFSFSGLKTAVIRYVNEQRDAGVDLNDADVVASFQKAAVKVLVKKVLNAAEEKSVSTLTLSGGVAANSALRDALIEEARQRDLRVCFPPLLMCTDNGAMIAGVGYHLYQDGVRSSFDLGALPSIPFN
ncbi:tRNA (adenosine(37)-N6)-threonylcarbamoyltransferase complex transferase subunit TsaD [candidate division KSB3 bacterium]|uniref:tRNA N6-adenosine threonylcarbamoyltransferase n=1 Tax=candidate division KSB3 bacterium TaxID=2044937 RepID=A0A2G6E215_9BACT|nr:MAG: tRNA (adenosine(37)-N6)-threonylcarbamoyltransferase complex transferase subunit TsaD [candidate division KSB3 bacterium]PIE28761.1 MAG: tRNA (adenosine(37)-N6)-threonylcarbamoyltransferase complex transferase subunit TsaD [candidate division KSB3 bacterium]